MKKQIYNPIFPLSEYVPDGEPHVFGDRVYLYGSHDQENGDRFCMNDYTVWSAPVTDLSDWTNHGVSYSKREDIRSADCKLVDYYAPDCVQGNDGKYYLYYVAMGPNVKNFGPMSVAVGDSPAGPFKYLSDIKYSDGTPVLRYLTNDPAVINDNGRIWMYYGWGLGRDFRSKLFSPVLDLVQSKLFGRSIAEIRSTEPSILSCAVMELHDDMFTVKSEPKCVLDSKTTADKNNPLYKHAYYEAPSIRKFGDLYYLVYSSGCNNELAYATSKYPDHDFVYRGVIISNSNLGYLGNKELHNNSGTIHGGIECINGQYYVFYHRCTNNTDFSRQAYAEPIEISGDGTIRQVEVTTQGLYGKPLTAIGKFPAAICCNLYNPRVKAKRGNGNTDKYPCVTLRDSERIIYGATKGTNIVYKYFDYSKAKQLVITARGKGKCNVFGKNIAIDSIDWTHHTAMLDVQGLGELRFVVAKGKIDLLEIEFI